MITPSLNTYQRRLWRLLHRPDATMRVFLHGRKYGYYYDIRWREGDEWRARTITVNTFQDLLLHCEVVRRTNAGADAYRADYKPRELVTDEDRAWMADYERRMAEEKERKRGEIY